jgi:hypothetical protein
MFLDQQVTYAFKNETGEEIPPYGVVVIEGATLEEGQIVFSVRKPTASDEIDQEPASVLFNAIQPVPDGLFGVGTRTLPVQALIEQPSSDHPSGLAVGLKVNSFALAIGGSCCKILAKDLTDPHIQSGHGVYFVEAYHGQTDFYIGRSTSGILGRVGTQMYKSNITIYLENSAGVLSVRSGDNFVGIQAYNIATEAVLANGWIKIWRVGKRYYCQGIC